MASEYRDLGFNCVTPFAKDASLPTTYDNPKDADPVNKGRPIRDCSRQGHAKLLNVAGRAQLHVLDHWSSTHRNFNMQHTSLFPPALDSCVKSLMSPHAGDPSVLLLSADGDIKQMYDFIEHSQALDAVYTTHTDITHVDPLPPPIPQALPLLPPPPPWHPATSYNFLSPLLSPRVTPAIHKFGDGGRGRCPTNRIVVQIQRVLS